MIKEMEAYDKLVYSAGQTKVADIDLNNLSATQVCTPTVLFLLELQVNIFYDSVITHSHFVLLDGLNYALNAF